MSVYSHSKRKKKGGMIFSFFAATVETKMSCFSVFSFQTEATLSVSQVRHLDNRQLDTFQQEAQV